MRLFVAVDISDAVRRRATALIARLDRQLSADATSGGRHPPRIAWVPGERLHLTLRFIGEVADDLVSDIEARLAPPFRIAPFEIELAGVGMFPVSGPPRVIWIGVHTGAEQVKVVEGETARRLAGLPLRSEDRPFTGHVTLGRVRTAGTRDRHGVQQLSLAEAGRCTIDHVTLYQSRLSSKGPSYLPRLRVPLAA